MRTGLVIALIGALTFTLGSTAFPWQTFTVAGLSANAIELGAGGLVACLAALAVGGLAIFGLASGRRAMASGTGMGLSLVTLAWLLWSRIDPSQSFELMHGEDFTGNLGLGLGLVGGLLMVGGSLMVRLTLPTWDTSHPSVRILALRRGEVVGERVVYEPDTVSMRDLADVSGEVIVTREGDVRVSARGPMRLNGEKIGLVGDKARAMVRAGDRLVVTGDILDDANTEIHVHHLAPLAGQTVTPLLAKSEIWAFGALALLVQSSALAAPILTWSAEPQREGLMCEAGRCSGVVPTPVETKVDVTEMDMPEPVADEPAATSSKGAGGPVGRFGDDRMTEPTVSKVPRTDGPLVQKIDPRKVGVLAIVGEATLGDTTALAEVLRGDVAATSSKLTAAMNGSDSELVLSPGSDGLSFQGDGDGGPGEGDGRILSQGDIETGGPGIKTALGNPNKRRVGDVTLGVPNTNGFCKQSAIASVVNRRKAAIRACYEKSLQVRDQLQGKVSVRWTIGLDGKVQNADATSDTLGDAATTQCILGWIRRMNFEKPEGGMCVVQWPFVFSNR